MDWKEAEHTFYCMPSLAPWLEQGWVRRFVGDERMVEEAKETYLSLGYEVKVVPLAFEDVPSDCKGCSLAQGKGFVLLVRVPSQREEARETDE